MTFFTKFDLYNTAFKSLFWQRIRIWEIFFGQLEATFPSNVYTYNEKLLFRIVETSFFYL